MLSTPLPVAKKRKEKLNSRQIGDATSSETLNYRVAQYSLKLNLENIPTPAFAGMNLKEQRWKS